MEMNQKINCTVSSCKYNNQQNEKNKNGGKQNVRTNLFRKKRRNR